MSADSRTGSVEQPSTQMLVTVERRRRAAGVGWWRSFRRSGTAVTGAICIVAILGFASIGPLLAPDPIAQDLGDRLAPPMWAGGTGEHVFGTDTLGRDVLARLAGGIQNSLWIVLVAMFASIVIGTVVGLIAGYFGGWFDSVVMRLADIQLAFPEILLILLVVATLGPGTGTLILVLALTGWVLYARVVRSQALSLKEKEFIDASHALGASDSRTLLRHIFPNLTAQITVIASFSTANIVLIEAALSFLGLGVPPPTPSLGSMIAEGQAYLVANPWLCIIPGAAIFVIVVGINLVADWLRDYLNPNSRK
ncbi:ABC transporter permease [Leucobacter sp. wl10]|uniref:ABC transporter permease n=1 Tax=Leucobacter sp. wl10 TaxID=2304677 RepID=UPI000E5BFC05|nr:ABC transporter permease [Leucobacter sp. wl10]RGE20047.1 ABC transporter permease [Leucobacter sp. wl10]